MGILAIILIKSIGRVIIQKQLEGVQQKGEKGQRQLRLAMATSPNGFLLAWPKQVVTQVAAARAARARC